LQQAKQTVPHFYLTLSANAEAMVKARQALGGIVWDAFFVWAVARAATAFGRMRCRFEDNQLLPIESDAIGVAVDVNDDLYVIAVEKPLVKSVQDISQHIIQQVESLHQGDPSARRLLPCWMTISNLGSAGIEAFAPIINPPQSAILGIGRIAPVPFVLDGGLVIQQRVTLTLAVDHRVASGKYAAAFLKRIIEEIEAIS
jgi:pyruvate/2-oxoglutarate dehydrogenase complex dihydrolipoamide acyltransferase (E2) component